VKDHMDGAQQASDIMQAELINMIYCSSAGSESIQTSNTYSGVLGDR